MKTFKHILYIVIIYTLFGCMGCKRYLAVKPDKKMAVISNLDELQGLLDDYNAVSWIDPPLLTEAADNYYLLDHDYNALPDHLRSLYRWDMSGIFPSDYNRDWSECYEIAYHANVVLKNIGEIKKNSVNQQKWNNVKGQAYFIRAWSFLLAASIWAPGYEKNTASTDLGIPLRLDPDFNIPSKRSSLKQTYDQIIKDCKNAIRLLPVTPIHVLRASKPAALGLLARTYLYIHEYDSCFKYANRCLQLKNDLLDYNILPQNDPYPFAKFKMEANPEIIKTNTGHITLLSARAIIDSGLYRSYNLNDLRKYCFFRVDGDGNPKYKGSYSGWAEMWDGIATDEVYLMRAECYARKGELDKAMNDLNTLLIKRWKKGTFVPYTSSSAEDALNTILTERRKELIMRNIRWMDIKRLNKEGRQIIITRVINGKTYKLLPNDPRYALPIPTYLVDEFGIQQNPY